MHICLVLGPYLPPPPGPAGAVERLWMETAEHFVKAGHRVTVVCRALDGGESYPTGGPFEFRPVRGGRRSNSLPKDLVGDLGYTRRALRRIPDCDVIVGNTFWLPILRAGRRKSRNQVVCHNLQRFPKGGWHLRLYRKLDRVLAVSTAVRNAVENQYPALLPRTTIVPNPIDASVFTMTRPPKSDDPAQPTVLFTGRVTAEKGLHLLVEAAAQLAEDVAGLRLVVVGESAADRGGGGPEYVAKLNRLAGDKLTLDFRDAIYDRPGLAEALRGGDVYCYPSIADFGESFGVAPLEAMGVGCPTVVSGLECFQEFARPGENCLRFDHRADDAVDQLTAHLRTLFADPALARRLGDRAAEDAKRFDARHVAQQYLDVFTATLAEKRGVAGEVAAT